MRDFDFRPVDRPDVPFCWTIYRDAMRPLVEEWMPWDEKAQRSAIDDVLSSAGASILIAGEADAGWLHVSETRHRIHLGDLYLLPEARNKGLGTRFLGWMSERARRKKKDFTLDVMKNNRARFLYWRLGFGTVADLPYKFTLQLDAR
jgi:ribosomal protein S18 acetylase RimI-like enzyme